MKDIRARMPQDPKGDWDGGVDPIRSGTLGMRMTRLREIHGMISWRKKKGSEQIKAYLDSLLPQACKDANSIKDFRVLHPHEKFALHLGNIGQMPERGHADTKDLSDAKKAAVNSEARAKYDSLKAAFEAKQAVGAAVVGQDTSSSSEVDFEALLDLEEADDSDAEDVLRNLDLSGEYNDSDWLSNLMQRNQASANDTDTGAKVSEVEASGTHINEGGPTSVADTSNTFDADNECEFLALEAEHQVHQDLLNQLLEPTRLQFASLTGRQPAPTIPTTSYYEQLDELQKELQEFWDTTGNQGQAPDLLGLAHLTRGEIQWSNPAETRTFPRDTMVLIAQLLVDFE